MRAAKRRRAIAAGLAGLALATALGAGVFLAPAGAPLHGQGDAAAGDLLCASFGGGPPYAFETYEATRDRQPYLLAQRLAAVNALLPGDADFALPALESGPAGQRRPSAAATVPAVLLHAIGWIESRLTQAAAHVPFEGVGAVLLSSSCAYGLMQVASFFSNEGGTPSRAEALAGTHYAYNVAAGTQILAGKWNQDLVPVVGVGQSEFVESWYYATWAYNGWALSNHPAGPEVDPFRSPYACDGPYNGYPYQELVLGCVRDPPRLDGGAPLWEAAPVRLPDLATLAQPGGPLDPTHFFAGWATVLSAPFTGAPVGRPFAAMDAPLPPRAAPWGGPPPPSAAAREAILGRPRPTVDGAALRLTFSDDVTRPGRLVIGNAGDGVLAYRLVADVDWLHTSVAAGVAVGRPPAPRALPAAVRVEALAHGLPAGRYQGTIVVEVLLPDGTVAAAPVGVTLEKQGVPHYEAGRPQS